MTIVLPGYTFKDLGPDGGVFDVTTKPKLLWHTMETKNISAAEGAYGPYPPHLGVIPPWTTSTTPIKRQYVGLERCAYAMNGAENDDEFVIQVEVGGFAKEMRNAPDTILRWLAEHVVVPLEKAIGIPRNITEFGFRDTGFLASPDSPIRYSSAGFRDFSGHCGHQHAPAPDSHWDPGALNVARILQFAEEINPITEEGEALLMPVAKNDDDARRCLLRQWFMEYLGRGFKSVEEQNLHVLNFVNNGADMALASIVDSPEAQSYRTKTTDTR